MVDLHPSILVITLNINGQDTLMKSNWLGKKRKRLGV